MDRFSNERRKPSAGTLLPSPSSGQRSGFQRRSDAASSEDPSRAVADALRHPGQPLEASVRDAAERRLGFDFSHVRIHTDESAAASARELHANAYTLGPHIVFGNGGYARDAKPGAPSPPSQLSPTPQETAERQARNAYPKNPRAAALYKKMILGTITQPELSELRGIASFPDNPRAAALYAKLDAGTITPAEQDELSGYLMRLADQQLALGGDLASVEGRRENPRAAALRAKQAAGPLSRQEKAELQGLDGYPDNPRAAALHTKQILGKLTKEETAEFQGFNAYPNNRRAAALYTKHILGKLTKEESAELQAFDTYPYNPRAAALYKRMLLGEQLTPDEKGEVYDDNYYQSMGEFLIRLERRAREGRLREEEGWVYERLRHDPKVLRRAALIRQSGGPAASLIDD